MLACYSLQRWVQIKLSDKGPTCPEGVATHTVPSYEQTPLHAVGLQRLPKAKNGMGAQRLQRKREKRGTERCKGKVRRREKGRRAACKLSRTWQTYSWTETEGGGRREELGSTGKFGPSGRSVPLPDPEVWLGDSRPTCRGAPYTDTHTGTGEGKA